jgi:hypothetical protein
MNVDPSGNFSIASVSISISIGLTLTGGSEAAVGGSAAQILRQAVYGAETGIIFALSIPLDRELEIGWAGLLGGVSNFIVATVGDSI